MKGKLIIDPRVLVKGGGSEYNCTKLCKIGGMRCPISNGQFNMNSGIRQRLFQFGHSVKIPLGSCNGC